MVVPTPEERIGGEGIGRVSVGKQRTNQEAMYVHTYALGWRECV